MRRRGNTAKVIVGMVLLILGIAALIYFGYVFFQAEKVEVVNNGKYTRIYIEGLADIPEGTHMLMLDEEQIKKNIEENEPYLEVVSIKKKFPQTVVVEVKERQPKAVIAYNDTFLLADMDANVLEILDEMPAVHYPIVSGLTISGIALGQQVATEDTFKITVMGELLTALENRKLTESISQIDLADINNIRMMSMMGIEIKFGQADKITDKVRMIDNTLNTLKKEGRTSGILDVSSLLSIFYPNADAADNQADTQQGDDAVSNDPANGGDDGTESDPTPSGQANTGDGGDGTAGNNGAEGGDNEG